MNGDTRFWLLFGGLWLSIGVIFSVTSLAVHLFVDPAALNEPDLLPMFLGVGLVAAAAGSLIVCRARAAAARDRRLMGSGLQLAATVTEIRQSAIKINREPRWHVVYRYEYTKGRPLDGKSRALPGEMVWALKPGDKVLIKVDPQQPNESLFLGAA
jgi:hypothetical protein